MGSPYTPAERRLADAYRSMQVVGDPSTVRTRRAAQILRKARCGLRDGDARQVGRPRPVFGRKERTWQTRTRTKVAPGIRPIPTRSILTARSSEGGRAVEFGPE